MDVEAGPLRQPGAHLSLRGRAALYGVLVGAVVAHDQVHVQPIRNRVLNLAREDPELLMPLHGLALGDYLASGHVQGREQGGGAVAYVVIHQTLDVGQAQPLRGSRWLRQKGLGPIQGLDLHLLVDAKHHRLVRRIQVQPNDVADLLHE